MLALGADGRLGHRDHAGRELVGSGAIEIPLALLLSLRLARDPAAGRGRRLRRAPR